jgi:hypothetical protein
MSTPPAIPPRPGLLAKLKDVIDVLIPEAFATFLLLAIVGGSRKLLELWIGHDAKFFDVLPVRWVFDAGELIIVCYFLWRILRKFR